jgi:hypothetical protein
MQSLVSRKSASALAASLPAMERRRHDLSARMGAYIARFADHEAYPGDSQLAGLALTNFLFDQAERIVPARPPRGHPSEPRLGTVSLAERALSCFGDGLGPIMKDLLGAEASPGALAAWGDAYWASVRAAADQEYPVAA